MNGLRLPPHRASASHATAGKLALAKLASRVCLGLALAGLSIWFVDLPLGLTTRWERWAIPVLAVMYAVLSLAFHLRPRRVQVWACLAIVLSGGYFWGVLWASAQVPATLSLYCLGSNAQFMPLMYVGAFVALTARAELLCWTLYASVALAAALLHWGGIWQPAHAQLGPLEGLDAQASSHLWAGILLTHPCYIFALRHIASLKSQAERARADSQGVKERFLALVAHEIRTPLQAMSISIDLLERSATTNDAKLKRVVDRLRRVCSDLANQLQDLTEYTRLDNPDWRLVMSQASLSDVLQQVCDQFQARAQARELSLTCELEPSVAAITVYSDLSRLRQILDNLLINALKFTQQGGIQVHASLVSELPPPPQIPNATPATSDAQTDSSQGPWARICVQDSGVGIPASALQQIFEPYVRLDDSQLPEFEGSGLGLVVVRLLAARLGAYLDVESQPQAGSRFTVYLPLNGAGSMQSAHNDAH